MTTSQALVLMDGGFENLLYEDIQRAIYREDCETGDLEACPLRVLEDFPFKLIEIWIFKEGEKIDYSINPYDDLKTSEVQEYLKDETIPAPEGTIILGGLRLLVQEWPRKWQPSNQDGSRQSVSSSQDSLSSLQASMHSFVSWLRMKRETGEAGILPFSKYTLDLMTKKFCLPRSYPKDLLGDVPIPLHCTLLDPASTREGGDGPDISANLRFVLQSPKYEDERTFVSSVLSYDPIKNITSGFLGYVKDESQNSPGRVIENILLSLKSDYFAPSAANPLLIPSLVLNCWFSLNKSKIDTSNFNLNNVKDKIRFIKHQRQYYFESKDQLRRRKRDAYNSYINDLSTNPYELLSNSIIATRELLTESSTFSETLCKNCLDSLDAVSKRASHSATFNRHEKKLQGFLLYLKGDIAAYDQYRERLVSSLQVSLNDLSNFTQITLQQYYGETSKHMEEAKKRSNAISVAVSFLSALFLPATVIATIFGMVEFFTVEDGQLQTSPTWTIYWKWTGGITGGLLLMWLIFVLLHYGLESLFPPPSTWSHPFRKPKLFPPPSTWPHPFRKPQNGPPVPSPTPSVSPNSSHNRQPMSSTPPTVPAHSDIEKQPISPQGELYNYSNSSRLATSNSELAQSWGWSRTLIRQLHKIWDWVS